MSFTKKGQLLCQVTQPDEYDDEFPTRNSEMEPTAKISQHPHEDTREVAEEIS